MTLEEAIAALKAAQSKIDSLESDLKKHADAKNEAQVSTLRTQVDQANAALDAAKADVKRLQDAKDTKARTDADVIAKVSVIDGARLLHGKADEVAPTDDNRAIMVKALASRDSAFKADGKSDAYIEAAFDIAVKAQKNADASNANMNRSSAAGGAGSASVSITDAGDELDRLFRAYDNAPDGLLKRMNDAWQPSELRKMHADGAKLTLPPRKPMVYSERFDARQMLAKITSWCEDAIPGFGRRDADPTTMFFPRQLLYIMTTPYEFIYPEIKYQDIFQVSNEVPTGARSYTFHMYDELGQADIVDDYGDEAPNVDRKGIELIGKIIPIRTSWRISVQDMRSGSFGNVPIEAMKSVTARRLIERKCDLLAAVGDTPHSFQGAANNSNVPSYTLATKAAGTTRWGSLSGSTITYVATPEEILRDIGGMATTIKLNSAGAIEPDTLILGTQNTAVIDNLRLDQFNQATVGDYLRGGKIPWLKKVVYWPRLDTATGGKEEIVVCKSTPDMFRFVVPQEFEQFPPEPRNLAFIVNCHKRWAEPQMIQPKAFLYASGSTQ